MPQIHTNYNLKSLNTFGIDAKCSYYTEIHSIQDFTELAKNPLYSEQKKLILGGGSNLLFVKDFEGMVIRNCLKGIEIVEENEAYTLVKASAGEIWHDFVIWCIQNDLGGLENLSLIPGCVGASPMQNIGAYGVEIKEVFEELEAISMNGAMKRRFSKSECAFGYRESVFKREYKNQFFITSVTFRLSRKHEVNTSYGAIGAELKAMNIESPGISEVSRAVIRIRSSKLPDPKILGNAGSFFKNPEVDAGEYSKLKLKHPDIIAYPLEVGSYKLAAGWLIEQCGLKGFEMKGAAVHDKQALVIVNKNNAKGMDVYNLSEHVLSSVYIKFGVKLEREVNIIG